MEQGKSTLALAVREVRGGTKMFGRHGRVGASKEEWISGAFAVLHLRGVEAWLNWWLKHHSHSTWGRLCALRAITQPSPWLHMQNHVSVMQVLQALNGLSN